MFTGTCKVCIHVSFSYLLENNYDYVTRLVIPFDVDNQESIKKNDSFVSSLRQNKVRIMTINNNDTKKNKRRTVTCLEPLSFGIYATML